MSDHENMVSMLEPFLTHLVSRFLQFCLFSVYGRDYFHTIIWWNRLQLICCWSVIDPRHVLKLTFSPFITGKVTISSSLHDIVYAKNERHFRNWWPSSTTALHFMYETILWFALLLTSWSRVVKNLKNYSKPIDKNPREPGLTEYALTV